MPITRTIYTQGAVSISGFAFPNVFLSGVQSAGVSISTPRQDVNFFGVLGSVNKVQLEPTSATAEVSYYINDFNTGVLPFLISNSKDNNPTYYDINISGLGIVKNAILSSLTISASMGDIPSISLNFEGQSGVSLQAGVAPTVPTTSSMSVQIPSTVSGIMSSGGSVCAQSINLSWEMPVEKINCLGNSINNASILPRFPGTTSFQIDGTQAPYLVTGLNIGLHEITFPKALEVSRSHNMGIGDVAATYNLSQECTALDLNFHEDINYVFSESDISKVQNEVYTKESSPIPKGVNFNLFYNISSFITSVDDIEVIFVAVFTDGTTQTLDGNYYVNPNANLTDAAPNFTLDKNAKVVMTITCGATAGNYDFEVSNFQIVTT